MKIWCESCEGIGTVTNALSLGSGIRGIGAVQSERCNKCEGKGYTEHEENLEDLELAQAVRYLMSRTVTADVILSCAEVENVSELLEWYHKEQQTKNVSCFKCIYFSETQSTNECKATGDYCYPAHNVTECEYFERA